MEGNSQNEKDLPTRAYADRYLRSYKKWNDMLSSRKSAFDLDFDLSFDESIIQSQMYSIRAIILSVEDQRQKMFLYLHYIKGVPVEKCTRVMNISRRTAFRLKSRALDTVGEMIKDKKVNF